MIVSSKYRRFGLKNGVKTVSSGTSVDLFDHGKCCASVLQSGRRLTAEPDVFEKLRGLELPRQVRSRELPDRRLGRPHLRQHPIEGEAFQAVTSAETFGDETRELESEVEFELGSLARTRYGFWTDFKYHWRPAWLKRTFLGRPFEDPHFIPIFRYDRIWLNRNLAELSFSNGIVTELETGDLEQDRASLGLSYRPVRNFAMQFVYERNRRVNGEVLIFPRVKTNATNGLVTGMVFSF